MTEKKDPKEEPVLTEEEQAKAELQERIDNYRKRVAEVTGGMPEAGGISYGTVYYHGIEISVTQRANTAYDALASLLAGLTLAKASLGVTFGREPAPKPVIATGSFGPSPFDPPATPAQAPSSAPDPQPVAPLSAPASDGVQEFIATKFEIVPRADGKADMKFYEAGHRYPDLYSTMTIEYCVNYMTPTGEWTEQHFKQYGTYDVNYRVKWKNSDKLNSKGNP